MKAEEIRQIARQIAKELKKGSVLVGPGDVAMMCGYVPHSMVARKVLADPTFPPGVELTPGGDKRYLREDVIEWIKSRFVAQSELALATMAER